MSNGTKIIIAVLVLGIGIGFQLPFYLAALLDILYK